MINIHSLKEMKKEQNVNRFFQSFSNLNQSIDVYHSNLVPLVYRK